MTERDRTIKQIGRAAGVTLEQLFQYFQAIYVFPLRKSAWILVVRQILFARHLAGACKILHPVKATVGTAQQYLVLGELLPNVRRHPWQVRVAVPLLKTSHSAGVTADLISRLATILKAYSSSMSASSTWSRTNVRF